MTRNELAFRITGHAVYIDRHRPMLMQIELYLFLVGMVFYVSGITIDAAYTVETWGGILFHQPSWFWGALNAVASATCVIGLIKPPRYRIILIGAGMHLLHFSAIAISCLFYGGDFAIGLWALGFLGFHAKMFYEAARLA